MATDKPNRKQPAAKTLEATSLLGPKIASLLLSIGTGNVVGSFIASANILNDLTKKPREQFTYNLALDSNRKQILREVEQQAKQAGCTLNIVDLDIEAQVTMGAGFDFDNLLDNLENLENLPALWNVKRTAPLGRGSGDHDKYHDLLVVKNLQALIPLLKTMPKFQDLMLVYVSRKGKTVLELSTAQQALIEEKTQHIIAFEKHYREGIVAHCNTVELFIRHDALQDPEREQELEIAYVALKLAREEDSGKNGAGIGANTLQDSLNSGMRRLLLLGKAGSGKTTLLRWAAIQAANSNLIGKWLHRIGEPVRSQIAQGIAINWRNKIPFLLRMRDFQNQPFPELKDFSRCKEVVMNPPDDWAENALTEGRAALLLDGLDELSTERRKEALVWISSLAHTYSPDNLIVVSSRPAAMEVGKLDAIGFVEYEICDLSPDGKREFIDNWHKAVAVKLSPATDVQEQHEKDRVRMREQLESSFQLKQLASNPLLCALLCALNRVNRGKLPENLYELCKSACKMLLKDRDNTRELEQNLALPLYHALSDTERRDAAQQIAYEMVKSWTALLPKANVLTAIRDARGRRPGEGNAEIEQIYEGLLKRSGLLRMSGSDDVEFVHNTLRDYLAGLTFAENGEHRDLLERLDEVEGRQRWEPILLFAVASEHHKPFVLALMQALLDFSDVPLEHRRYRELLLLKANGRMQYTLPTVLEDQINDVAKNLVPIDSNEKAEAIAGEGEGALEFLVWRAGMPVLEAAACVHGLGMIDHDEAHRRLNVILKDDHQPDVLDELVRCFTPAEMAAAVNVLDIPAVIKQVQSAKGADEVYRPFIHNLEPLKACTQLQILYLDGTQVSDLEPLAHMKNLHIFGFNETN